MRTPPFGRGGGVYDVAGSRVAAPELVTRDEMVAGGPGTVAVEGLRGR